MRASETEGIKAEKLLRVYFLLGYRTRVFSQLQLLFQSL